MRPEMRVVALLLCLALAGCASAPVPVCPSGLKAANVAKLYFGRNIGTHQGVSDEDWAGFVTREIMPRFPDGFTVADAAGGWRGPDGRFVHERSKVLTVVLADGARAQPKLDAIRAAYVRRFHQDSVLEIEGAACVVF